MNVEVSDHAYWRAAERFRGFDTLLIEEEVLAGMREGRVSAKRPVGFAPNPHPTSIYVWTPDGERLYAVKAADNALVVSTVMKKDPQRAMGPG
jgi:hypothetical protein